MEISLQFPQQNQRLLDVDLGLPGWPKICLLYHLFSLLQFFRPMFCSTESFDSKIRSAVTSPAHPYTPVPPVTIPDWTPGSLLYFSSDYPYSFFFFFLAFHMKVRTNQLPIPSNLFIRFIADQSITIKNKHDNTAIIWNYVLKGKEHIPAESFVTQSFW